MSSRPQTIIPSLPIEPTLSQAELLAALRAMEKSGIDLDGQLAALLEWSSNVGYFSHLGRENDRLAWSDTELGLDLRLQINYSRLGYNPGMAVHALGCPLCYENIASAGKPLLRAHEFPLAGQDYFCHPTPFPLCPGHFVLNRRQHEPMQVTPGTLNEAMEFVSRAPGWLLASNSDVEWAGSSVLGHHHFQIFRHLDLPIESATATGHHDSNATLVETLHWPSPSVRLSGSRADVYIRAVSIMKAWRDEDPGKTTFNYLLRERRGTFTLTLLFRHPDYRTPESLRTIKAEGVGIIEMAGEVVVPPPTERTETENHLWFQQNGLGIARGIIGGNAPSAPRYPREFFDHLIANSI